MLREHSDTLFHPPRRRGRCLVDRVARLRILAAAAGLGLALAGCDGEPSAPDQPLTETDQAQFENPLAFAAWTEPGSWPQFAHDPLHTGRGDVDFPSADLEFAWSFRPSEHVWVYKEGYCVWSPPVVGTVAGRTLVIAGYYDHNVYAVDAATGKQAWAFPPGQPVFASPALGRVGDRDMVFIAATNRSIYGLDAATGQKVWQFETQEWAFTGQPSKMSSPTIVRDGDRTLLLVGVWNADRSASRNVQLGELIALELEPDGYKLLWRKRLASVPVWSPAVAKLDGKFLVFVSTHHGELHALNLADGTSAWKTLLNEQTMSSPSLALDRGLGRVLIGTHLHTMLGHDLHTGTRRWRGQAGFWIDATPAWIATETGASVVAGSQDQYVYGWSVADGQQQWKTKTGNYVPTSPSVATVAGRPVAFVISWDEHLYMFDVANGRELWKTRCEPLIWSHVLQGSAVWPPPVVARVGDTPTVLFPAFDGVLYAYQPKNGARTATSAAAD